MSKKAIEELYEAMMGMPSRHRSHACYANRYNGYKDCREAAGISIILLGSVWETWLAPEQPQRNDEARPAGRHNRIGQIGFYTYEYEVTVKPVTNHNDHALLRTSRLVEGTRRNTKGK
ncbi:hypothetical protein GGX14DRAFT_396361 [Mycena pura]|uniref:Uncharacterized protein n=1 Tax=Mycena pura TaxID=153505 RepID=A0AAD6VEN4_9AGAR|nr:hypothetical protein GGX14DRAFT_396361 [Mycena pura]